MFSALNDMKRILLIAVAVLAGCSDDAPNPVATLAPVKLATAVTNWATVYISPRGDKGGTGTMLDPFDASTPEQLFGLWDQFNSHQGKTLVFLPGTYYVDRTLMLSQHMTDVYLKGEGARLVFTNNAARGTVSVIQSHWDGNPRVVVDGLTIDCGSYVKFVADGKVAGIVLKGSANVVRNCRVLNMVSANFTQNVHEAFGIILESKHGMAYANTVERMIVPSGVGGGTGLVVMGDGNLANGNTIYMGDPSYKNGYYSFGLSTYGNENVLSGNSVSGCDMALAMDHGGNGEFAGRVWRDNVISGNRLSASQIAFRIHPISQGFANWTIVGNQFNTELMWIDLFHHQPAFKSNVITGFSFVGNHFGGKARAKHNVALSGFEWHRFTGNSWDVPVDVAKDGGGIIYWGEDQPRAR